VIVVSDPENTSSKTKVLSIDEQSQKVADFYNNGINCDNAVLLVLQDILKLPTEKWDFDDFYSENPDADRFLCKALAAGAMAIYLDVIEKMDTGHQIQLQGKESIQRVNQIFNMHLEESSREEGMDPAEFDPFKHDEKLKNIKVDEKFKKAYRHRVKALCQAFEKKFHSCSCQGILGFDPFSYEDYDEKMQEYIEEGEWMQKCIDCMRFIVKRMGREPFT
jgi:hypothetical protein